MHSVKSRPLRYHRKEEIDMSKLIYLDNAATTKVHPQVLEAMMPYFSEEYGNPSSIYSFAGKSKKAVEDARQTVADFLGANANEIYFTGGGSESDNWALKATAFAKKEKGNHIITSKIEHPAILNSCKSLENKGFKISYIDVDKDGMLNLEKLESEITDQTILISIMYANNEIGTIQPISKIAKIAKAHNIIFHTDAVQAVGNVPIDVKKLGIDILSLSGHKIYAPKGIGAIYIKEGLEIERYIDGGHQEKNKRSGTENVAEIVGLGKACNIAQNDMSSYINKLKYFRDYFINQIRQKFPNSKINGSLEQRLPGNCNLCFSNINSGELLLKLDAVGICASGGSACSSGDTAPSHVLSAIGVPNELARGALRVTFGDFNTFEDVEFLIKNLEEITKNKITQ